MKSLPLIVRMALGSQISLFGETPLKPRGTAPVVVRAHTRHTDHGTVLVAQHTRHITPADAFRMRASELRAHVEAGGENGRVAQAEIERRDRRRGGVNEAPPAPAAAPAPPAPEPVAPQPPEPVAPQPPEPTKPANWDVISGGLPWEPRPPRPPAAPPPPTEPPNPLAGPQWTVGERIAGDYMGAPFTGKIWKRESDASGYRGTENDARVHITLDHDLYLTTPEGKPWLRGKAGDGVIAHGTWQKGRFVLNENDKVENVRLAPPVDEPSPEDQP